MCWCRRRIKKNSISAGDDCPGEWRKAIQSGVSFCRVASDEGSTCSAANFSTNEIRYQSVCGRVRGYQKGQTFGFYGSPSLLNRGINEDYVTGLSITYGSNLRQHIWTFNIGFSETTADSINYLSLFSSSKEYSSFLC